MKRFFTWVVLILSASTGFAQTSVPATQPADRAEMELQFEHMLSNATLVGSFTTDGAQGPIREDHYSLGDVRHLRGDLWLISAKIGRQQTAIPLVIPVKWAGDTPVISVTNFGVPGMGSYTARVVFYGDHYAGFWSGGQTHQGLMFGRVQRAGDAAGRGCEIAMPRVGVEPTTGES